MKNSWDELLSRMGIDQQIIENKKSRAVIVDFIIYNLLQGTVPAEKFSDYVQMYPKKEKSELTESKLTELLGIKVSFKNLKFWRENVEKGMQV